MRPNQFQDKIQISVLHSTGCTCKCCNGNTAVKGSQSTNNFAASLGTLDELANYLESGYWNAQGRSSRKFNLASKSKLNYNTTSNTQDLNGVSPERSYLIEEAFKLLGATLGINFQKTNAAGADFRFGDNDSGAYAYTRYTWEGEITYSEINIAESWHSGSTSLGDYVFQTTLHEIGHALGLGHLGNYNGSASYSSDADFINDSWHTSMMSYFDQTENTSTEASQVYLSTPMVADWIALDDLYNQYGFGINNAFTDDTIYGFDTNIGETTSLVFNKLKDLIPTTAYTIVDGGGNDTLDLSGFAATQLIDLRPSEKLATNIYASNIGGKIGNLSFAPGTLIESVIGGSGADTFRGNDANNSFDGRDGDDIALFSGEISDYSLYVDGESIVATDLRDGSPDGQDTLANIESIDFNGTTFGWNDLLIRLDITAPSISITHDDADDSLRAGETAALTFTLSEASTDFVESDVTLSGGSLSNWTAVSSTIYTATFTPTADSTTDGVISVASSKFSDAAGNTNNDGADANNSVTFTIDTVRPTIAVTSDVSSLKAGETSALTFTLSEASTDFVESDVTASGGSLSNWIAVSSTVYTATFTPTADSTTDGAISVASSKFSDAAGNTNNDGADANNSFILAVDTIKPIIVISAATSSVEIGDTTTITFTLSEESLDFGLEDVDVDNGRLVSWNEISNKKYSANFEQTDISDAEIIVSANSFTDIALNPNVNIERQGILASIPCVYRLRNDNSGRYLFSSNQGEIDIITGAGWTNEGIAYKSPAPSLTKTSSLHRYSMNGEGHFYTANAYEKGIIDSTMSWTYEGVAFQVYSHEQVLPEVNTVAVKRYLNTESNIHLYSTSSYEQGILNASPEWIYEGIAWYGETV